MNELEQLLPALCPECAALVRSVLATVKAAAAKEAEARHESNEAAAKERVESTLGEAEAVLKGKR